jgi:putative oxidoreductase
LRHVGLLVARVVFGGYLLIHGAQKLFGWFDGPGLDAVAAGFEKRGLRPGKLMAAVAGASEFGGGLLTATGIADPLGPLVIAGTMAVASTTHRKNGPMSGKGGFELPLTNLAMAVALMSVGPGVLRLGPHLPKSLIRKAVLGGTVLAGGSIAQMLLASAKQERQARNESVLVNDAAVASPSESRSS